MQAATPNSSLDYLPNCQPKNSCTKCKYKALTKSQLTFHIKRAHKNSPLPPAPKPPVSFDVPPPYNVLPSTPALTEPVMFKCFLCPSSYNQGEWSAHEKAAHCFTCNTCGETFPLDDDLRHHILTSHKVTSAPAPPDEIPTSDTSIPDIQSKNINVENAHWSPSDRQSSEKNTAEFKCDLCEYTSCLNRAIRTHMIQNHPPQTNQYSCDICDFATADNASLVEHIQAAHMKNSPGISVHKLQSFHCDKCSFTALKESTLRDHIKAKHESTSLQCELCPYSAPLKINLKRHIAVTHAKIQCDQCHFTSSSEFHLTLHKDQEHTQTQPKNTPKPSLSKNSLGLLPVTGGGCDGHVPPGEVVPFPFNGQASPQILPTEKF